MNFTKMHGCGNDYVYINCFRENVANPAELAVKMSDRHFGIGSDGLILICPGEKADCKMRMFNSDGSEAQMCGNGIRCVGKYVYENILKKEKISVETLAGIKTLEIQLDKNGKVSAITVDMGEPIFEAEKIPVIAEKSPVINLKIKADDREFEFSCVSMGNPHAVTFINERVCDFDVEKYGKILETDSHFPERANIEFCHKIDGANIEMRVWERGSGETLACGTGACAVAAAAYLNGICPKGSINIKLLGGTLVINRNEDNGHIYMTGPAETVFDGEWKE